MRKSIAVLGGKGGVGKTTLAINLALALHRIGEQSLVLDANLARPHVGLSLGDGLIEHSVHDAILGQSALASAVQYHSSGLRYIPGDHHYRGVKLTRETVKTCHDFAEVVVVDAPPADDSDVMHATDQALVVVTPQMPALRDAMRTLHDLERHQKTLVGVVLNGGTRHDLSPVMVERYLGKPVVCTIPHDDRFSRALAMRQPYLSLYPKTAASKAISDLAARIASRPAGERNA